MFYQCNKCNGRGYIEYEFPLQVIIVRVSLSPEATRGLLKYSIVWDKDEVREIDYPVFEFASLTPEEALNRINILLSLNPINYFSEITSKN